MLLEALLANLGGSKQRNTDRRVVQRWQGAAGVSYFLIQSPDVKSPAPWEPSASTVC